MKVIAFTVILAALIVPAEAKKRRGNAAQRERDRKEEQQEKKEREARERRHEAVSAFLDRKDKDHDGSVSRDEYLAGEGDKEAAGRKFDKFNKNGDRSLAKSEIEAMLGF